MILDGDTLEYAAKVLEQRSGNAIYRRAWRTAARALRDLKAKKLLDEPQVLTDKSAQISIPSSRPVP